MSFLSSLEEQAVFGFTGRVNVLSKSAGEYLGAVLTKDGVIVQSSFRGSSGERTLFRILIEDMDNDSIRFVVEPEIISESDAIFHRKVDSFKVEAKAKFQAYLESKKLKPPGHLRILIQPDFISRGPGVSAIEFDVLDVITEFSKVADIYQNLDYMEYEVTGALVSLRKKGALKVLA